VAEPVETVETSQAAAAATEAPVEGPPVEAAPAAAAAPVEAAPVEATPGRSGLPPKARRPGEAVTETGVDSQTEAAATENPVEG